MSADTDKQLKDLQDANTNLIRENEMLKTQLGQYKSQLKEAVDTFNIFRTKEQSREEAEREELMQSIEHDTKGRITKESLKNLNGADLKLMRTTIDRARVSSFISVAADNAEEKPKKVKNTVGEWDPDTKSWKGGLE